MKKLFLFALLTLMSLGAFAQAPGYALYGAVPYGYTDLTSVATLSANGSAVWADGTFTGAGLPGRINETSNYLKGEFTAAQTMTLTDKLALHVVIQKAAGATGNVQVSLCNGGWNATRLAWVINNADISDSEATDIALDYSAIATDNWNSYGHPNGFVDANGKSFSGEILRISAASGEQFTITQIYLDADATAADPIQPSVDDTQAPTNVSISAGTITSESIQLNLYAEDDHATVITYTITCNGNTVSTTGTAGATKVYTLTGLTPSTTYAISVVAKDANNNESASVVLTPSPTTLGEPVGYALYGTVPADYEDLTGVVTIAKAGNTNWEAPTFTGADYPGIIANTGHYLNVAFSAAQTLKLTDQFALHIRIKKHGEETGNVQVSLTSGNWNGCRAGWLITNSQLSGDYQDIVLKYAQTDATMQYSCEQKQNLLGARSFNGTIMRICATNGEQFDIEQIYLTKSYSVEEALPANVSVTPDATYKSVTLGLYAECELSTQVTYLIHFNGVAQENVVGRAGETTYVTYNNLNAETQYAYSVVARNENGGESAPVAGNVTTPAVPSIPVQPAQRIYLRKGSAVTPAGVAETADYSAGASLASAWWNCNVSNEFFGVTTQANWWFNFQLHNSAPVDLTPVYSTWRLVMRVRSQVVEEGTDRGLTITLGGDAQNVSFTTTYADYDQFVEVTIPMTEALSGPDHLAAIVSGDIMEMSSGNNNAGDRAIEFDYIYFTNESATPEPVLVYTLTAADNGYYTFYAEEEVAIPANMQAFTAELSADETYISLSELADVIPAQTGVLVKGAAAGEYEFYASETGANSTSVLQGVSVATPYANLQQIGKTLLELGTVEGQVCFCQPSSERSELAAHKAYLMVTTPAGGAAARVGIGAPLVVTGLDNASGEQTAIKRVINGVLLIERNGQLYNAAGMRVNDERLMIND